MAEINNLADLTLNAKQISNRQDFAEFCNKRDFEDQVNDLVARVNLTEELKVATEDYIEKNHEQENALCFVLFFTLYTIFRKSKTGNVYDFTKAHKDKFCGYEFFQIYRTFSRIRDFQRR